MVPYNPSSLLFLWFLTFYPLSLTMLHSIVHGLIAILVLGWLHSTVAAPAQRDFEGYLFVRDSMGNPTNVRDFDSRHGCVDNDGQFSTFNNCAKIRASIGKE